MGDGEIWGSDGMGGASTAAGEVAMLELGEMFDAVEAAPGDRLPLGRVTPAKSKANLNVAPYRHEQVEFTSLTDNDGCENAEVGAIGTRRSDG